MPSPVASNKKPSTADERARATKERLMKALGPMKKIGEAPKKGMIGLAKGADSANKSADKAAKTAIKAADDKVKAARKKVAGLAGKLGL